MTGLQSRFLFVQFVEDGLNLTLQNGQVRVNGVPYFLKIYTKLLVNQNVSHSDYVGRGHVGVLIS